VTATDHGLLRAILERPHDDAARLIYADWLDDQGEVKRAEFVRLQIELSNGYDCVCGPTAEGRFTCTPCRVRLRERELWGSWPDTDDIRSVLHSEWEPVVGNNEWVILPQSLDCHAGDGQSAIVRRGFVDEVRCRLADWIGAECRKCSGKGYFRVDERGEYGHDIYQADCHDCHGTGRIGAHGPQIVLSQPITRVSLTDIRLGNFIPPVLLPWQGNGPWTEDNVGPAALRWARDAAGLPALP
jgi:uncharacterized protein (TIGR02996 family)